MTTLAFASPFVRAALLALACSACNQSSEKEFRSDESIPCRTDEDCPPLACGPCKPGEVVTQFRAHVDCKVNPCVGSHAVCGADGACVVGEAAKEPPPREPPPSKREEEPTRIDAPTSADGRSSSEVAAGFEKARAHALACKGAPRGMKITIQADIDAAGNVLFAKALTNAFLPVTQCVAKAVKTHARFPKSTRVLDSQSFTYTF